MQIPKLSRAKTVTAVAGVVLAHWSPAARGQVRQGKVAAQSLPVYSEMSADSEQVTTLAHDAAVQILFSVTTGDGSWCSVADAKSSTKLGYVECNQLAIESAPREAAAPLSDIAAPGSRPTGQQEVWALAVTAIASTINRAGTSTLAADTPEQARKILAAGWQVHNREDLFNALGDIEDGREIAILSTLGQRISGLSEADFNKFLSRLTPSQAKAARVVRQYNTMYQGQNLTGWEYARYIDVCRWGVSAGYMTPDEAWPRIMSAARTIQGSFGSWREFGQNYLLGWKITPTETMGEPLRETPQAAYDWLISDPSSPWRRISWNLPLN